MTHPEAFAAYAPEYVAREIDPAFKMLDGIFSRYELSQEQRIWAAFLYAIFYQPATVFWVMQEFPDYEKVDLGRFKRWLHGLGPKTVYSLFQLPDRKYGMRIKKGGGPYQVEPVLDSYFARSGPQAASLAGKSFLQVMKPYGRHTGLCFAETLYRCCGYKAQFDELGLPSYTEVADGASHKGLAHYAGLKYPTAKTKAEKRRANRAAAALVAPVAVQVGTDYGLDPMYVETVACAFRKLVQGKMYLGYYLDRMSEQIKEIEAIPAANGVHWETLWQIRAEQFGYSDRVGIREQKRKHYKRTGNILPWPPS